MTLDNLVKRISHFITYNNDSFSLLRQFEFQAVYRSVISGGENSKNLASDIKQFLHHKDVLFKLHTVNVISELFNNQIDDNAKARVSELKAALSNQHAGWKAVCLSDTVQKDQDVHFVRHAFTTDASLPVKIAAQRFTWFENPQQQGTTLVGSTFTSNNPNFINVKSNHVLDAAYTARTYNNQGEQEGIILALADGCGGHFGDELQDKRISRVAHFSVKRAVEILAGYEKPENFLNQPKEMIAALAQDIKRKVWGENATLLCCRAFPTSDQKYHIVGFNIGDGLLAAFLPEEKRIITLAPAVVSEHGVAQFPENYKADEVNIINVELPENSLLFGISDGFVDGLPSLTTEFINETGTRFRKISLDETEMNKLLTHDHKENNNLAKYLINLLLNRTVNQVEDERQSKISINDQIFQIGDDVSIAVMPLPKIDLKFKFSL